MKSLSLFLTFTLFISYAAQLTSAGNAENARKPRQFFRPSYNSLYSLYLRYLYENVYANEPSAPDSLRLSWNGLADNEDAYTSQVQARQNIFGLSNINSAINPFASFFNRLPNTFIRNPDASSLTNSFASCKDASNLDGICIPSMSCVKYGGRPSGACGLGTVCCVNTISKCGGQVTLNNTYWRSPSVVSPGTTCGLTLTLDDNLIEQRRKICQVRIDLISFTLEQPNAETLCNVDTFQVAGTKNTVPVICGDNSNQHMYLTPPSSVTDLQLSFTFGESTITRSWNIKISLLPCLASYLAPPDCLQYFMASSGTIKSFNWRDIKSTVPRQLANQNYKICFRTELVASMAATRICYTQCAITNGGLAFSLTSATNPDKSQDTLGRCNNDFLLIPGGFDPTKPSTTTTNTWDRYCGRALNTKLNDAPATVCSVVEGFSVTYKTNDDETNIVTKDPATGASAVANTGFCLDFQQRTA